MKTLSVRTQQGILRLTDRNYLAGGGQAAIYRIVNQAVKIYHDPTRMIPVGKMQDLAKLSAPNIIKPLEIVYDSSNGDPLGYVMKFVEDAVSLCKLFTRTFKDSNQIDQSGVTEIVRDLQNTVASIHQDGYLVVDLNELNVLLPPAFDSVLMIDTDSYQTPNHPATAIMDSIRDRRSPKGRFTEGTDWFSFAVLAVQCYLNIHPYKGRHPAYKITDWQKRMDDGVSVFNPEVKLPVTCNPMGVIPPAHRRWLEGVFTRDDRSKPPLPEASSPLPVPAAIAIVRSTVAFTVTEIDAFDGPILWGGVGRLGIRHIVTTRSIYYGTKVVGSIPEKGVTARIGTSPANDLALALHRANHTVVYDAHGQVAMRMRSHGLFSMNDTFYTVSNASLYQVRPMIVNGRMITDNTVIENITEMAFQVFDGVVMQDILGRVYAAIPVADRVCLTRAVADLDGHRVIDAKAERGYLVVLAEHRGTYRRFYYSYQVNQSITLIAREDDVASEPVNFTVKDNGMAMLATDDNVLKLFTRNSRELHEMPNSPVDAGTPLFTSGNDVFFCHGNSVFQIKSNPKP